MDPSNRTFKPPVKISMLEKNDSEISHCWKACQLFSYVLVVISGVATCMSIGNIQLLFKKNCILYADLDVTVVNFTIHVVHGSTSSKWGNSTICSFCQFCPVASVIFAAIWGTLFVMCGKGGNAGSNLPQPWRIVPPAILFNFVFVILSIVSASFTFRGFSYFCAEILSQVNITSCEDLVEYSWFPYTDAINFYDDVVIAETGAAVGLVGWLLGFIILLIRVLTHADFHVLARPAQSTPVHSQNTISTQVPTGPPSEVTTPQRSEASQPLIIIESSVQHHHR